MKNKKKFTVANALVVALAITFVFIVLQLYNIVDLYLLTYNICSWIGYFILSIMVAWCFNKQPCVIKMCIMLIIALSLLVLYTILADVVSYAIPYVNTLGIGLFGSFIVCVFYSIIFADKSTNQNSKNPNLDEPQYLIQAIYKGLYVSRNDLYRFYLNYTSKKDTFIDLLKTICDVCQYSIDNKDFSSQIKEQSTKVYSIVSSILKEETDAEYLMNVLGKERESLLALHKITQKLKKEEGELALKHLTLIADYVVLSQEKLITENERNTQSLTISIVGILLTIIFSLLSFLTTSGYSSLQKYIDYIG